MTDSKGFASLASSTRKMRWPLFALTLLAIFVPAFVSAQEIPALLSFPPGVAVAHSELIAKRAALVTKRNELRTQTGDHNSRCGAVIDGSSAATACLQELQALTVALEQHIDKSNLYNAAVLKAEQESGETTADCQWDAQGSSLADPRCMGLAPDKPILLDPHQLSPQERATMAMVDPATFENANYNNGYAALMRTGFSVEDALDAVQYFQRALIERPGDPMVRNGLLLAQDILKGRQIKEQQDKDKAMQSIYLSIASMASGDMATAGQYAKSASQIHPDPITANWRLTVTEMALTFKDPVQDRETVKMIGNAMISEAWGDFQSEIGEMEKAKSLAPDSIYVDLMLDHARSLAAANNAAPPNP